jgi:hypothetical protein
MINLDYSQPQSGVQWCSLPFPWARDVEADPQSHTWVRLLEPLNPFCYDEALLLCQESESAWVVWIPEYGEALLYTHQFCIDPKPQPSYSR